LNVSSSAVRVIKSRRMRWVGHTARIGRIEKDKSEGLGVGGRILLKRILKK
jgi:hypothetical protein